MNQQPKVLILEDEIMVAWSLREVLILTGYEVVGIAARVSDALCLAENTRPDVAIIDVRLAGDRDGIEAAQLLQQQFGIRAVFLTATWDKETKQRASFLDPAGFLVKPVHSWQLIQAIRTAAGEARSTANAALG
jgi:DNA-binding NarL/FixJ family response regulator